MNRSSASHAALLINLETWTVNMGRKENNGGYYMDREIPAAESSKGKVLLVFGAVIFGAYLLLRQQ